MSMPPPYFTILQNKLICLVIYEMNNGEDLIGFPKLIPVDYQTDIIISDQNYLRIRGYDTWFKTPFKTLVKYLQKIDMFGETIFCFPKAEVKMVVHPLTYSNVTLKQPNVIEELIDALSDIIGIPHEDIGVEGSFLLGYAKETSDIDILVYGYQNSQRLKERFPLLGTKTSIKLYDKSDYEMIYQNQQSLGYGKNKKSIISQELRRFHGSIAGRQFGLISVLKNETLQPINPNRKIEYLRMFNSTLMITDTTFGAVTPSVYQAKDINQENYKIEIISPYGINQARIGEHFDIVGKLYQDSQSKERIIILSFWSQIKEQFNLH